MLARALPPQALCATLHGCSNTPIETRRHAHQPPSAASGPADNSAPDSTLPLSDSSVEDPWDEEFLELAYPRSPSPEIVLFLQSSAVNMRPPEGMGSEFADLSPSPLSPASPSLSHTQISAHIPTTDFAPATPISPRKRQAPLSPARARVNKSRPHEREELLTKTNSVDSSTTSLIIPDTTSGSTRASASALPVCSDGSDPLSHSPRLPSFVMDHDPASESDSSASSSPLPPIPLVLLPSPRPLTPRTVQLPDFFQSNAACAPPSDQSSSPVASAPHPRASGSSGPQSPPRPTTRIRCIRLILGPPPVSSIPSVLAETSSVPPPSPPPRRHPQSGRKPLLPPGPYMTKKTRGRIVPLAASEAAHSLSARKHVCPVPECSKRFQRLHHLHRHFRSIHTDDKRMLAPLLGLCQR
ncbi:hypothetical protein FA95DRAFT_867712 [Auriscalpium vulgare]|uniref:Uncharacterized protein n=1 Tax=Auriscalpium vulgare TaxID=40419 RepID=A0ACB8RA46_9AGAM|nr:hypothetical protein FA95DRAFT_867712 [Auriscalpium vulgare]